MKNISPFPRSRRPADCGRLLAAFLQTALLTSGRGQTTAPPSITAPPVSQTVIAGQTAGFTVGVTSSAPFHCQWQLNGRNLPGATNVVLTVPGAGLSQAGGYSVTISNAGGAVTAAASLGVVPWSVLPLYSFSRLVNNRNPDGAAPAATLSQGADGAFYGVASAGGAAAGGTVFQITANGTFQTLYAFTNGLDGADPVARLLQTSDGALYGAADLGGSAQSGALFRVSANGVFTPLYSFSILGAGQLTPQDSSSSAASRTNTDGAYPASGLIQCADGGLYGLAAGGGVDGNGTLFRLETNGTFTPLHSFGGITAGTNSDGANPYGRLVQGGDGGLYGTTAAGGAAGSGTVFRATTNGGLATLYAFTNGVDGSKPVSRLVQGQDKRLYGTASAGGANGGGTVFAITTNGIFTPLYSFSAPEVTGGPDADGTLPAGGLIQSADGYLYGATENGGASGDGTLFRMNTNGELTTLYYFNGKTDGANPAAALAGGADGNFYGTAIAGGTNGNGAVFELINPASPPRFTVEPSAQTALAGGSATLSATVSGPPPFTYQWFFDGSAIPGATASSLILTNLEASQAGNYSVVVGDLAASVTSAVARLTVNAWPLVPLYTFTNGVDGAAPDGALIQGQDGNLYAAASAGGAFGNGTIYSITAQGVFSSLYSLSASSFHPASGNYTNADGARPQGLLFQASDGNLYSTTEFGGAAGAGTLFRITTGGVFTTLYSFTNGLDGANPVARMFQATDGSLYGEASKGGANGNGTVFRLTLGGQFTPLYSFSALGRSAGGLLTNSDGASPTGRLIQATDGQLYSVTSSGGAGGGGTVFRITTGGLLATLYNFTNGVDGSKPAARLLQASDGALYDTTSLGGTNGGGGIFRITTNGVFTPLYSFGPAQFFNTPNEDGANSLAALIQGLDGRLYGTASEGGAFGEGTVFQITTNGQFTTLYNFTGAADGATPVTSLLQTPDGNLYGLASAGGTDGRGVVFELLNPNPPPVFTSEPASVIASVGGGATLSATVIGGGPLYYQWQFNGTNIIGATNAVLTLENLTAAHTGAYSLVVSSPYGSATSAPATLSLNLATLRPLHQFGDGGDGSVPLAGLIQARDGNYYGTTQNGGTNGTGSIFQITADGVFNSLYSFTATANGANADGAQPDGRLLQAADGNLYGVTTVGGTNGQGTIFRITLLYEITSQNSAPGGNSQGIITTFGQFALVHTFSAADASGANLEGAQPYGGLMQGADGGLYGTAQGGGTNGNGTVFRMTTNGQFTVLHTFGAQDSFGQNPDGAAPLGELIQTADGALYGTANGGGSNGYGTVYRVSTNGAFAPLYTFSGGNDGAYPWAGLVQAPDGGLYGATPGGGASGLGENGSGALFRVTTNGSFNSLYSFSPMDPAGVNADGAQPLASLIHARDGFLYGTTSIDGPAGNGTLFRITTNGAFTLLYSFSSTAGSGTNLDGADPYGQLLQGSDGNFYGAASAGGADGFGTVFELFNLQSTPVFTAEPAGQDLSSGGAATLGVTVAGPGPFAVQWQLNGAALPGATNATLTLAGWSATQAGGYSAVASNPNGSVTSAVARLPFFGLALSPSGSGFLPVITLGDIPGSQYRLDTSTDLGAASNWTTLSNITLTTSPRSVGDPNGSASPRRFYRAVAGP